MKHPLCALTASSVLLFSCSDPASNDAGGLNGSPDFRQDLTCVVASPDSTSVILGSRAPHFTIYSPSDNTFESRSLPAFTDKWKTYDILPLSANEFLVGKQNCGVVYVRYSDAADGRHAIEHVGRVAAPQSPLPSKDTRFSAYSLIRKDSLILIGSSNGLKFLTTDDLNRLRSDSLVSARYVAPLAHMRERRVQFSQESLFVIGDSLLTVTDHGIYMLPVSGLSSPECGYKVFDAEMRCWDAALGHDSIAVLWSPDDSSESRRVTRFSLHGKRGSTVTVDPSVTWLGNYGDSIRFFGNEGTFQCFRSATMLGPDFYFIRDGKLARSTPGSKRSESDEYLLFADNGYGLSNRYGLWHLDTEDCRPVFIGDLKGVSGVRDISVGGGKMYLAVADGVYLVSLSDHMLAHDRHAALVESNRHKSSDRVESILVRSDTLLIGTRSGLHSLSLASGNATYYKFARLDSIYESPYVRHITPAQEGGFLVETMNFGVWRLPSFSTPALIQTPDRSIARPDYLEGALFRPAMTWRTIGENIVLIIASILILIGLVAVVLAFIQKRHRMQTRLLNLAIAEEHKAFVAEKQKSQRHIEELSARKEELVRLREEHEQTVERLRSEFEEAKASAARKIHAPMRYVAEALERTIEEIGPESPEYRFLSECLNPINKYLEADSDDTPLADAATSAYRRLCNYCADVIASSAKLIADIPASGVLSTPLMEYKEEVSRLENAADRSLAVQLEWLTGYHRLMKRLYSRTLEAVSDFCIKRGEDNPVFKSESLNEIWSQIVLPVAHVRIRKALSKRSLEEETDNGILQRSWICVALSFFACDSPTVVGHDLTVDIRSLVRFENSERLGTVYNFWADQLSAGCFGYNDAGMPSSAADLLWKVWLSQPLLPTVSNNTEKRNAEPTSDTVTLANGIRLAFARRNNQDVPEALKKFLSGRTKGRPRKA